MSKFKVGDAVIVNSKNGLLDDFYGKKLIIKNMTKKDALTKEIHPIGDYQYNCDNIGYWLDDSDIKLDNSSIIRQKLGII